MKTLGLLFFGFEHSEKPFSENETREKYTFYYDKKRGCGQNPKETEMENGFTLCELLVSLI